MGNLVTEEREKRFLKENKVALLLFLSYLSNLKDSQG